MAPVMHLLGCSAPPVLHIGAAANAGRERGWDVCVGLTPTAAEWIGADLHALESEGRPVRVAPRKPGDPSAWPPANVVVIAPATLNTINAVALGLTPTAVAGAAVGAIGAGVPVVVLPCVNSALAAHPQLELSIATLRSVGVRVLYGNDGWVPNRPGEGSPHHFPWHLVFDEAETTRSEDRTRKR